MGTNFYVHTDKCDKCGRYNKLHIGKRSRGWAFVFHYNFEKELDSYAKWKEFLESENGTIECDNSVCYPLEEPGKISPSEMMKIIDSTKGGRTFQSGEWLADEHFTDPEGWPFMGGEFC